MNMNASRPRPASIPPTEVARKLLDIRHDLQRELQRVDTLLAMLGAPVAAAGCQPDTPAGRGPNFGETSASDLLYGAPAIAGYLGLTEKQARHRIEAGNIPAFKIGGTVCARQSSLSTWLANLEAAAAHAED
jgi:hypothetical protein